MHNFVVVLIVCVHVGGPKNVGDTGATPLGIGVWLATSFYPTCDTVTNSVSLGQTVRV